MNAFDDMIFKQFYEYWDRQVKAGYFSAFDREERLSIEIFYRWLKEHYCILATGGKVDGKKEDKA